MNKTAAVQQPKTASFLPFPQEGLLQRKCACGNYTVAGGECAECGKNKSRLQRQLAIGASNDPLELEADRVADQVMATPVHSAVSGPRIQRYAGQASAYMDTVPPSVDRVLASSGRSLEPMLRQDMESRFGHDFSQVRIHTGDLAEQSARAVNANAYTVGHNIVFSADSLSPGTSKGRRLIAHELTHVVQQSGGDRILANQSPAQRELLPNSREREQISGMHRVLQRSMGFEFQVRENIVTTNKGQKFHTKSGKFFHKVPPEGKGGVELQTDTGGVIEFETPPFRKWSDLKAQIQNAVDVVKEINKDPKAFRFNQESRLEKMGLLKRGETLEVNVKDKTFLADIQSTEGFALAQYESILKEHEKREDDYIRPVVSGAQNVLDTAMKASKKVKPGTNLNNLRGFLQIIMNYIERGRLELSDVQQVEPVKSTFRLRHRTNFSSTFTNLLTKDEQTLFREIIKSNAIPKELVVDPKGQFFLNGYWGHVAGRDEMMWALYQGGKIVALATDDKQTIHDCSSKAKTQGIDTSKCGNKVPASLITIEGWLNSIINKPNDALSPPPGGGSETMGKLPVSTKGEEKGLVIFEVREYQAPRNRQQPVNKWVDFAEDVFQEAAVCRARPGTGTELLYDGTKKFDSKNCP